MQLRHVKLLTDLRGETQRSGHVLQPLLTALGRQIGFGRETEKARHIKSRTYFAVKVEPFLQPNNTFRRLARLTQRPAERDQRVGPGLGMLKLLAQSEQL